FPPTRSGSSRERRSGSCKAEPEPSSHTATKVYAPRVPATSLSGDFDGQVGVALRAAAQRVRGLDAHRRGGQRRHRATDRRRYPVPQGWSGASKSVGPSPLEIGWTTGRISRSDPAPRPEHAMRFAPRSVNLGARQLVGHTTAAARAPPRPLRSNGLSDPRPSGYSPDRRPTRTDPDLVRYHAAPPPDPSAHDRGEYRAAPHDDRQA